MQENNYDDLFARLKKEKYDSLTEAYLEFEGSYKNKQKAIKDYSKTARKEELALTEFEINDTLYFDDFKKDIESKMNFSHERFNNPSSYMIKNYLPEIIQNYREQKEYYISRNQDPRFDFEYFDNFIESDAVKLFAEIKAHEQFSDYLFNRQAELYDRQKELEGIYETVKKVDGIMIRYNSNETVIKELHKQLYDNALINADLQEFEIHFEENMDFKPMKWYGSTPEILYLFEYLKIPAEKIYSYILNHFLNQKGNLFNSHNLHSAKSKMSSRQEKMMQIIKKIEKIS